MRFAVLASAVAAFASTAHAAEPPTVRELVDRLKDLEDQVALIERESALPVERGQLWAGAARGMVEAVDPYGGYLAAEEVAIYGLGSEPLRVGCGFDWRQDGDGRVVVTRVVRDSPAARAGLHPGAAILAVNGLDPARASRREVAEGLARSGDQVALSVLLAGAAAATSVTLKRVELDDDGIAAAGPLGGGVGVVRIGRFIPAGEGQDATATAAGLRQALARLADSKALVLDLRGCAGGNLQAAVEIAAAWIPGGAVVVEQAGRDPARARTWSASVARLPELPLVLLVDGGTASSAEVLAHALRHYLHAPVVGMPTLGKGTVQQLFLLPHGDALRLTVARLKSPSGAALDQPLRPDVVVAQEAAVTWRRWHDEIVHPGTYTGAPIAPGGPVPEPDPQLERAAEIARALLVGR